MLSNFLPKLPEGFRWQLFTEDGCDCTDDYLAECVAHEARIWSVAAEPLLVLQRTGDFGFWGEEGQRKWVIVGPCPEGLMDWEQFETLSSTTHRLAALKEDA